MSDDALLTPIDAFLLGVDIEEVFNTFGEAVQLQLGGLPEAKYESVERKAQRIRRWLVGFKCPFQLVQRFEEALSKVYRRDDPRAGDVEWLYAEGVEAGLLLNAVMVETREYLGPDDAALYDLGIMLARLHLCLRMCLYLLPLVKEQDPTGLGNLYATELQRVVPLVREFLASAKDAMLPSESKQLSKRLRSLSQEIEAWDGGSEEWCRATFKRVERVFASVGLLPTPLTPERLPAPLTPERSSLPQVDEDAAMVKDKQIEVVIRELRDTQQRGKELFAAREFDAAEQTQRKLIEYCRHCIGYNHPFTLRVRADLLATLIALHRGDLAADLAYDLADDAGRRFGERDANTARACVDALFVLMCTRKFDECANFLSSRLGWLYTADPNSLDRELAEVQRNLLELTGGSPRL